MGSILRSGGESKGEKGTKKRKINNGMTKTRKNGRNEMQKWAGVKESGRKSEREEGTKERK